MAARSEQRTGNTLTRGRARRVFKVGELATSVGSSYVVEALKWPFRSAGKRQQGLLDAHIRNAIKIVEGSQQLKGAFMKLVQMLSMRDDILPPQALDILSVVQSHVPPMEYPLIREQVRRELGAYPEELFASFDEQAFAAASLGQVHAARLPNGEEVVVKVQYPGVDETVKQDLQNIKTLLRTFALIGRDVMRQKIDPSDVYRELEERLHEELDYVNEAKNIALFQKMFRDDDEIVIPQVYPDFSSRRVLTMSRVEGYPFADILNPGVDQALKDWVALKYFHALWRQVFEFGVLHTDPHPGNYLVTFHPKLVILDFGSIRIFPEPIRKAYHTLARAILARDEATMADCFVRLGFLDKGDDPKPMVRIMYLIFEPVMVDRRYDPRDFHSVERAMEIATIGFEARIFKTPGHRVFLARALMGLDAYLKQFGTVTNWHREFKACVEQVKG
ncbi:MAG TPA: AarF/ABC1/UbiB kinase family protein [Candidatus Binatia bacterium]|nr:AarF/ABC1/UbiB kinase family protein [Candidatus Binatia bacterium]